MTGFSIPDASESQDSPHKYDIEHVPVENDPRKWTPFRKVRRLLDLHYLQYRSYAFQNFTLVLISSAATIAGFATNIQNRP